MKILYISAGKHPDYMGDMILHGLRSIYQQDVIDYPICWYMYNDLKEKYWERNIPDNGKSFGRGFTIAGTLPNIQIDRDNIEEKILDHHFDLIIYGSCKRSLDHLDLVTSIYKRNEIIFIDGEDQTDIDFNLVYKGLYFKRELIYSDERIYPINFCIPKEKISHENFEKINHYASIIPGDEKTYIYDNEKDYYDGYRKSYFGLTCKKGGWDCLRHYEIMANNCVPYFANIENCPERTLFFFPKDICIAVNKDLEKESITDDEWKEHQKKILIHLEKYLTTESMAKYIIEISDFEKIEIE